MDVAWFQSNPVHGGQVAYGVRGVGVLHQFGLGGGAGGEVQQQVFIRSSGDVQLEFGRSVF